MQVLALVGTAPAVVVEGEQAMMAGFPKLGMTPAIAVSQAATLATATPSICLGVVALRVMSLESRLAWLLWVEAVVVLMVVGLVVGVSTVVVAMVPEVKRAHVQDLRPRRYQLWCHGYR